MIFHACFELLFEVAVNQLLDLLLDTHQLLQHILAVDDLVDLLLVNQAVLWDDFHRSKLLVVFVHRSVDLATCADANKLLDLHGHALDFEVLRDTLAHVLGSLL